MSRNTLMFGKTFVCLGALLGALAGGPNAASAQEEVIKTSDVYVTAGRVEQELQDVPMSVSVMTEKDLKRSSARTVGEFLQDIPGLQINDSGGQGIKRIKLRGESPNRVLILVDGQKIVENKSMDGTPLLINTSRIERVEVIKGPASVLYGSEAIGGVVNIITKQGGTRPVQAELAFSYHGASQGYGESASLFGAIGGFQYRLNAAYEDHENVRTPAGKMPNTSFHQGDLSAFLSYEFEKLTIGGGYDFFTSGVNSGSMEAGYENFYVHIPTWERHKYYAFAEFKDLTSFLPRIRLDVFNQRNEKFMNNRVDTDVRIIKMPLVLDNYAHNYNDNLGISLQTDWMFGDRFYLVTGYDYSRDKLKATSWASGRTSIERVNAVTGMPLAPLRMQMTNTRNRTERASLYDIMARGMNYDSIAWHEGTMDTHALYAQLETQLPWDFTLNVGVRQTWVKSKMTRADGLRYSYEKEFASPMLNSRVPGGVMYAGKTPGWGTYDVGTTGSKSDSRPVFNAGLTWSGIPDLTLRLTFAQGFRVPSLQDRYVTSSMGGGTIQPNPDLKPETSNSYEFGGRWNPGKFALDGAIFYSTADNYIGSFTVDPVEQITTYRNVASAKTFGAELALSYDFDSGLTPYASVTYMRRKYNYGSWDSNRQADGTWHTGDPRLTGRVGLRFERQFTDNVNFFADLYGRFSSSSKLLDYETHNSQPYPVITKYGGWGTVNLGAGFDFGKEGQYTVSAEFLNILDKRYQFDDSMYQPGRSINVRLSMRF